MGYETPVELPSMGVYDTDLMKLYIAGAKDQYEKAREDMKDFMKTYGDFYSDIPGATELYNNLTVGGANKLIGEMYARGIDPYKSPQAQQLIGRYIASAPVGLLKQMELSAKNYDAYKQQLAKAINNPYFDPEYNKYMLGGDPEKWDPKKPWTATAPYIAPSPEEYAKPYMEKFKQSERLKSDIPGYIKLGTTDENIQGAISAVMDNFGNTPYGRYRREQAERVADSAVNTDGTPLTNEQKAAYAQQLYEQPVRDYARQFFQPAYEVDPYKQAEHSARMHAKYSNSGGDRPNTKGNTSWFDTWYKAYHMNVRGNNLTIFDGQRAYVSTLFNKNAKSGLRMTTAKANSLLRKSGSQMDPVIIAKLLGKKLNDDGTITLNSADLSNMKFSTETASRMAYVPKTGYNASNAFKNSEEKSNIQKAINNNEPFKIDAHNISMIVQEDGNAQIVIPGTVMYGKGRFTVPNTVLETDLRGNIDASGNFVPDNNTAARLMVADQIGTDIYANQSNYTKTLE